MREHWISCILTLGKVILSPFQHVKTIWSRLWHCKLERKLSEYLIQMVNTAAEICQMGLLRIDPGPRLPFHPQESLVQGPGPMVA